MSVRDEPGEPEAAVSAQANEPASAPVVFIVGAGVVGTALAARLAGAGVPVLGLHGRCTERSAKAGALAGVRASAGEIPESLSAAEVIIIAVPDDRIREVVERLVRERRLRSHQILLHTSGANASGDILGPARLHVKALGTFHPLASFADPQVAMEGLSHVAFGLEGQDEARRVARKLVVRLGAYSVDISAENLALYHVGAVLVSNYVVALADLGRGVLVKAGVAEDLALVALIPLMSSVVQNLARVGLPGALTGPVARGDVSSVARHVSVLAERAPEVLTLYKTLGKDILRIACSKAPLEPDTVARLEALFS